MSRSRLRESACPQGLTDEVRDSGLRGRLDRRFTRLPGFIVASVFALAGTAAAGDVNLHHASAENPAYVALVDYVRQIGGEAGDPVATRPHVRADRLAGDPVAALRSFVTEIAPQDDTPDGGLLRLAAAAASAG